MKIGYARVSTRDQHLELQLDALKQAGCEKVYQDVANGAKTERPALDELLTNLRSGDVVVIWKLDRLGRSLRHLVDLMGQFNAKNVGLQSLNDPIDTTSAQGRLLFNLFASLAEFERELIRERTHAGLSAARARGRVGGRPKGLPPQAAATALAAETLYRERRLSVSAIAKKLHISKSTLYSYLRRRGVEIGPYQKQPAQRSGSAPAAAQRPGDCPRKRMATIHLRLQVENSRQSVRGKKRSLENIERFHLQAYSMKKLAFGRYMLAVPYQENADLDQAMRNLLAELSFEAGVRHCLIKIDAWQEGTERRWRTA